MNIHPLSSIEEVYLIFKNEGYSIFDNLGFFNEKFCFSQKPKKYYFTVHLQQVVHTNFQFKILRNLSLTQLLNNKVKKEHEKLDDGKGSLRSHDGVFLRPVPVTSPPTGNGRFAKRSSVDSGINMDIRTRSGKYFKDSMKG